MARHSRARDAAAERIAGQIAAVCLVMSLRLVLTTQTLACRALPSLVALCVFLTLSAIYLLGHQDAYRTILSLYGIEPFKFPFVDISGSLAAWDCTRLGIDVVEHDPCDVLGRAYTYSPLWITASFIPLGKSATGAVGWVLGLLFILSLPLLPPVRRAWELVLIVLATSSTMVVFAVERANPDIIIFMMGLLTGLLAGGLPAGPASRLSDRAVCRAHQVLSDYLAYSIVPRTGRGACRERPGDDGIGCAFSRRLSPRYRARLPPHSSRLLFHRSVRGEEFAVRPDRIDLWALRWVREHFGL